MSLSPLSGFTGSGIHQKFLEQNAYSFVFSFYSQHDPPPRIMLRFNRSAANCLAISANLLLARFFSLRFVTQERNKILIRSSTTSPVKSLGCYELTLMSKKMNTLYGLLPINNILIEITCVENREKAQCVLLCRIIWLLRKNFTTSLSFWQIWFSLGQFFSPRLI